MCAYVCIYKDVFDSQSVNLPQFHGDGYHHKNAVSHLYIKAQPLKGFQMTFKLEI